ncbi:MAG: amiC [Candidatus Aminicenantes bacterium]|nr:amiC [Candidatus Aminicenantes bacterium]
MIGLNETTAKHPACFCLLFLSLISLAAAQPTLRVSAEDHDDYSRVIVTFPSSLAYSIEKDGPLLLVRVSSSSSFRLKAEPVKSRFIKAFSWAKSSDLYIIIIETRHERFRQETFEIGKKSQLVIDFYELGELPRGEAAQAEAPRAPSGVENKEELPPAAEGTAPRVEGSASGARGIRTIVIDPGHGGLEVGARGKFGTLEKDVTLAISLRLKALIEKSLAFNVELTRDRDLDVSLENRAAMANNHRAELFISIHANSSYRRNANGSETFFLSLNATDEEARRLAYLENNSADLEKPLAPENEGDIQMILWDMAQAAYLKQSQRLAEIIQDELNTLLNTKDRGIKQAPFKVLTGVACPAVLVESAFISNPEEERELVREGFQEKVAQAIYRGLVRYIKLLP